MTGLAEQIAMKFYNEKKNLEFMRVTYSKTSLKPGTWTHCPEKERMEWIEAAKRMLADQDLMRVIARSSEL
jgi:hypothetical protein